MLKLRFKARMTQTAEERNQASLQPHGGVSRSGRVSSMAPGSAGHVVMILALAG